ncbi:hypothetical protein TNCV_428311 [Trichonephila clavipes]|nr:hypothetical protein TNCV_428311 [Trichonephila clavipes]
MLSSEDARYVWNNCRLITRSGHLLEHLSAQSSRTRKWAQLDLGPNGLFRKQVAGRNYPPTNKNTLIRALTKKWDKLPQQLLDNVVQKYEDHMRSILRYYPYKLQLVKELLPHDFETRHLFSLQFLARLEVDPEWPWNILWTEENTFIWNR